MDPKRYSWRDAAGEHELALVWVPGTDGTPYSFGGGTAQRPADLRGFFIATTPVTQALWQHVMRSNPAVRPDLRCPIENVSWEHITQPDGFLERINESEIRPHVAAGDDRLRFRLPSETEWECAARGGPH